MPKADYSESHVWVGAANIGLSDKQALHAVLRHSVRVSEMKVDVLEVYCFQCRRPWDDVADELCAAAASNGHLRGGPIGTRKKRRHEHRCDLLGCENTGTHDDEGDAPLTAAG